MRAKGMGTAPNETPVPECILLPRTLHARPDIPLVDVADGRVGRVPAFPAIRRTAMIRNRRVAQRGDDPQQDVLVENARGEVGDICRRMSV